MEYEPVEHDDRWDIGGWAWWRRDVCREDLPAELFNALEGGELNDGDNVYRAYPTREAAVAALDAARAKAGGGNAIAVELLAALRSVAAEIRDRHGSLEEQNWVPEFHLDLTLTVAECRVILAAVARAES